jgi:hypothetical protein
MQERHTKTQEILELLLGISMYSKLRVWLQWLYHFSFIPPHIFCTFQIYFGRSFSLSLRLAKYRSHTQKHKNIWNFCCTPTLRFGFKSCIKFSQISRMYAFFIFQLISFGYLSLYLCRSHTKCRSATQKRKKYRSCSWGSVCTVNLEFGYNGCINFHSYLPIYFVHFEFI